MITNPSAVKFCNERVRVLADQIARVHTTIGLLAAEWEAKGLGDLIPDDAKEIVEDGSSVDGRTPISGADVHQMLSLVKDLLAMGSGPNTRMPTVLKVAVNVGQ